MSAPTNEAPTLTLREATEQHIRSVIEQCGGNLSEAARRLGVYRSTLKRRLRAMGGRP